MSELNNQSASKDNTKQTKLWQVCARVPYLAVDGCVNVFENSGFLGLSWTECTDVPASDDLDDNGFPIASEFQIDAYHSNYPDLEYLRGALSCVISLLGKPQLIDTLSLSVKEVDDTDWLESCYVGMPAHIYGNFYIYGSHIKELPPENLIPVLVDAATAFGSGDHPTTRGCLTMLSSLAQKKEFTTVLDMGCGSGILGIAAKKRFPDATIIMADNDPESVRVALKNAQINGVEVTCYQSEGFTNEAIVIDEPYYDLILANILAKPLCILSTGFWKHAQSGTYVVLSGLLSRHGEMVQRQYEAVGFTLHETLNIDDWLTLVFCKA